MTEIPLAASPPTSPERSALGTLAEVGVALCGTLDLRDLLSMMVRRGAAGVDAELGSIMLLEETSGLLRWEVAVDQDTAPLEQLTVPVGQGISGSVAATGESVLVQDAQSDPRWRGRFYDDATGQTTRNILCVPIRGRFGVIGVMQVLNKRSGSFTDEDRVLLEALSGMGGVAIENARLYGSLESQVTARTAELAGTLDELRHTQATLVHAEKMRSLGDLVAGVAHEINTPLGAVTNNVDLQRRALTRLRDSLAEATIDDKTRRWLDKAIEIGDVSTEACRRIGAIVRSLRTFSRLDEAEEQLADLGECLESTLPLVAHELKKGIEVVRDYGELPKIRCRPGQLNQVFLNLLVNAAHAIEGRGAITLRTRAAGDRVVVDIEDSGSGIPAEGLSRIFDPGFTTKGVGVGTGLGLAICMKIVAEHGGTLEVANTSATGTTFRITLPAA